MPKAFDRVRIARKVSRPTSLDYITHIFEDFIEFHGDRNFADDKAIVGGIGVGAEERGQGEAIARNLFELAKIKVPTISIVIGEGGSGGALALAVTDRVWMLENSVYSVLSPEGFASILWKDPKRFQEAADVMRLTAQDLYELGVIEKVIKEVNGGCQNDFGFTANLLKSKLEIEVNILQSKDLETLLKERYERFRKYGEFSE